MTQWTKEEMQKQIDEKKAYVEKIKAELYATAGQIQLLEQMLQTKNG